MGCDSLDVIEPYLLDGVEVIPAEIEIAREQPIRADIRSLAAHRRKRAEMMTERYFFCLYQFLCRDAGLLHLVENMQHQLLRYFAFLWIESGIDAKQARIAGRVGECRYPIDQTGLFPHAPVQARTAPVAENGRKKIERGNVRIRDLRNVPGEREVRQFSGKFLVNFPAAQLRRFLRNEDWLE